MITLTLLHPLKPIPVQTWNFEHESVIRIGRSTDNQVVLYSAVVSRHHVELRRMGATWEIVNLGTNGTYLDGKRITQVPVADGAIIRLARSGPNIQIRMGNGAAKGLSDALAGDRTMNQRGETSQIETEITSQQQHAESSARKPPEEQPPKGTIPVPAHLRLPQPAPKLPLSEGDRAIALVAKPSLLDAPTVIQQPCAHPRGGTLFCPDCGQPLRVLGTLGSYLLLKVLGKGKIGVTYLAWRDGLTLTLKTLHPDWVDHANARAALECETETLRQLHHPRLPHLLDHSTAAHPYLVMEFMPGQNLAQRVASCGVLPVHQAIDWVLQVCEVLSYLHAFTPPIVHRGIQPTHLICRTRLGVDKIALVGFGAIKALVLSQADADDAAAVGVVNSDRPYAAPEHLELDATPSADLYSLGLTLAFLVTGQNPVSFFRDDGQGYRFCAQTIPGLRPALSTVLSTLTHPEPQQRYPTAEALAEALRQAARSL